MERAKDAAPTTSTFIWWPVLFLAVVWLCRDVTQATAPVRLLHPVVYHTTPGQDASTLNLILDWF